MFKPTGKERCAQPCVKLINNNIKITNRLFISTLIVKKNVYTSLYIKFNIIPVLKVWVFSRFPLNNTRWLGTNTVGGQRYGIRKGSRVSGLCSK